ncbi:outer membrane beta-barrel protein [Altererythrobacter sp. CC-YST694]|uniref:OmpW/AlkL family protein n=1 Tax=Altererythrobacter sp. CC-YST694 TaxID=2755038 RepID=UPI001D00D8DA|nr:OmpW family outer membrane protein [Altererythrobacter sp. CC-YST694]MCB5426003.1 outer membrane beta-barrel protein [Altererythrobacter sp. CC-YST694]
MRMMTAAVALATAFALSVPAHAEDGASGDKGKWQIKLLGSAVLADGKLTDKTKDLVGLPNNLETKANDNYVPTIAVEYFFTDNISVETICCVTQHDVDGTVGLPGAELVSDAKIIPATLTLKYHVDAGPIKPYVGVGPTYFIFIDEKPGAAAKTLGADGFKLNDKFGVALQAGVDVPLGDNGLSLALDAKKYFLNTSAHWYVGQTEVITTRHALDPWVLSAGLGFRF